MSRPPGFTKGATFANGQAIHTLTIFVPFGMAVAGSSGSSVNSYQFYAETPATTYTVGCFNGSTNFIGTNRLGVEVGDITTAKILLTTQLVYTKITVTYSASMTIDSSVGSYASITATNATAFTINAPTNPVNGQPLTIVIRNTSGGALGAVTWNAVFKMSAWTSPATGFSRSICFFYDGTNWVQVSQTGVDVPN